MKIKLIAIMLLCISNYEGFAQKQFAPPTEKEWNTYITTREKQLVNKIYQLAIEGKLKIYFNDSLATPISPKLWQMYNDNSENILNNTKTTPFNPDRLAGFLFTKTIQTSFLETKELSTLKAVALSYTPAIQDMGKIFRFPLGFFSITELNNVLTPSESAFISTLYFFARNGNTIWHLSSIETDLYKDIIFQKPVATIIYTTNTTLIKNISHSLYNVNFSIEELLLNHVNTFEIFDHQIQKPIVLSKFQTNYYTQMVVFLYLDANDPTFGIDSVIKVPYELKVIKNITIDTVNFKIKSFNYEFPHPLEIDKITYFSIPAEPIRKLNTFPVVFWLFEDYFRWNNIKK